MNFINLMKVLQNKPLTAGVFVSVPKGVAHPFSRWCDNSCFRLRLRRAPILPSAFLPLLPSPERGTAVSAKRGKWPASRWMVVTKTAIYLSWPSKAASWWLIHARHANNRKELIEEAGQATARVTLQSQVPPLSHRLAFVCRQTSPVLVTRHFLSFARLDMWDIHVDLLLIPDFSIGPFAFSTWALQSAPAAPPRQTNTAWWWTGLFFIFFCFFFRFF